MKDVAIYMRLSKEDDLIRDESNSISNQRKLLLGHVEKLPELAGRRVLEFKDDGYSGKSMDRPAIQELLELVRNGRIGAILCKDISRFSRDYLVSGRYLEQIFPFMEDVADVLLERREKRGLRLGELSREMEHLMTNRENLRARIQDKYEEYIDGAASNEEYLTLKRGLDVEIAGLDARIEALSVDVGTLKDEIRQMDVGEVDRGLLLPEAVTKKMADLFVDQVVMWPDGRMEVKWTFCSEGAEQG